MPATNQPTFSRGEITPSAFGRIDLAGYANGVKTARNFITHVHGGAVNRPGTDMVFEFQDSTKKGRQIPFAFSIAQSYVNIHIASSMNVVKDGGLVLEANKTIAATTNATPVVVTSTAHGYVNGDRVFIEGTAIPALDGRYWTVANQTANTFELSGSIAPGSTSATGAVARVFKLVTPYTETQLPALKYTQLNDVMTLTTAGTRPKDLSRSDHAAWTLADMPFERGPFQDINATKFGETAKGVAVTAVTGSITIESSHSIFTSANVGQLFYIEQKDVGTPWEVAKDVTAGEVRRADGKYYEALNTATTGTLRPTHEIDVASDGAVKWLYLHNGHGDVLLTGFTDANTMTGTVKHRLPSEVVKTDHAITGAANNGAGLTRVTSVAHGFANDDYILVYDVAGTVEANGLWRISAVAADTFDLVDSVFVNAYTAGGTATRNGTYKWALGAWGGDQGWPAVVSYFQQRKVLAATTRQPLKVWYSGTNSFDFFGKSVPLVDDDSFDMILASNQANPIRHLIDIGKLIVFTAASTSDVRPLTVGGGKWTIPDDDNNPTLTPTKRSARPQGADYVLYIEEKGQTVQDMAYQFATNSYSGSDLSVLSKHLLEGFTIVAAAYQHVPFQILWMVRSDGALLGMTYHREQQIWGWHRHDSKNGVFEDVSCISEGGEDRVYLTCRRAIDGQTKRFCERLSSRLFTDMRDAQFLDCASRYDGRNNTATTMTLTGGTNWTIGESFTLSASAAKFISLDVNSEIHFTGADGRILRLLITGFSSPTVVTVTGNHTVPVELRSVAVAAWGHGRKTFTRLDYLEGQTVGILADAHVHPQLVVSDGQVTLQACAVVVIIGLPIESDFETLSLNIASAGGLLQNEKNVSAVRIMVKESRGIFAGSDADNLFEFAQRGEENYDDPVTPLTGIATIHISSKWDKAGRVFIRQTDPLPLSILSIIPEFEVGGSR